MIIAWWPRRQYYHYDGDRTPTLGLRAYTLLFLSFFIYLFLNREGLHVPHPTLPPHKSGGWKLDLGDVSNFSQTCQRITAGRTSINRNHPPWEKYPRRVYLAGDPDFPGLPRLDSMLCLVNRFTRNYEEPSKLLAKGEPPLLMGERIGGGFGGQILYISILSP